jgi:uncharacterized Zn finger protein (UPF0148 family)
MNLALAVKFGTNESLFLTNLCFWVEKNKANRVNYHDGRYWVYNTMEAWAELFPYFSKDQIRRLITKMKNQGILLVAVYNRVQYDRTQWYSVSDEVMMLYQGEFGKEELGTGGQKTMMGTLESKHGEDPAEPSGEEPSICPEGPLVAAEVPHPSASGGAWKRRNRHMEAVNSPDRSGEFATTIPYIKPNTKPAVAADELPKGQMAQSVENFEEAAAGFFAIEKLKTAISGIDKALVFDDQFYTAAAEYLSAQGFDDDFLSWLYDECRKRKPDNLRGLYFSLFAKEDLAALYRIVATERQRARAPVPQQTCPVCGNIHSQHLGRCPECGLEKEDKEDPAKIARHQKFHRLSQEQKDEYAREQWALFSQGLKSEAPLEETKAQWIMLDKKYRLLE